MRNRIVTVLAFAMIATILAGCKKPKMLVVDRTDGGELEVVSQFAAKHEDYKHWLSVLENYYKQSDNLDMLIWARREVNNLADTDATFKWSWQPEVTPPPAESLVDRDEGVLVEYAISSRHDYLAASADLEQFYDAKMIATNSLPVTGSEESLISDEAKAAVNSLNLVKKMRKNFCHIKTYLYNFNAEVPGEHLRPTDVDPSMELHEKGKSMLRTYSARKACQEQALLGLQKLVREHPKAMEIPLSAYYIAEIYKEYFDENLRAVHWYERAWQWNPEIDQPARFQAATVYDYRLKDFPKAIELYDASRLYDPYRVGNDNWARDRVEDLTNPEKQ